MRETGFEPVKTYSTGLSTLHHQLGQDRRHGLGLAGARCPLGDVYGGPVDPGWSGRSWLVIWGGHSATLRCSFAG
jgi:hypothetical protein